MMLLFSNIVLPVTVLYSAVNVWEPGLSPVTKQVAPALENPPFSPALYPIARVSAASTSPLPPVDVKLMKPAMLAALGVILAVTMTSA